MSLRYTGSNQLSFQLTYRFLEGYANLLGLKIEKQTAVHLAEYKLRACIFNNASKQFEGRFHDSIPCRLVESLHTGAVMCPIDQAVFFYCTQNDPTLILVIQLTGVFHTDTVEHRIILGWSMLPLFDRRGNMMRVGKSPSLDTVRLAMYEGSPRALFSLPHPTAKDIVEMVPVAGAILSCSLSPHPTLMRAAHLLPPNTVLSLDDTIPGLVPTTLPEAFPKLHESDSGVFEKVSLLLLPSVDDWEEDLLSSLVEDLDTDSTGSVTIEERRLKVLPYNGWCYVSSPVIGYLERGSPTTPGKMSLKSSTLGLRGGLVLKGSLELSTLIPHPLTEVVFQVEYVISWSRSAIFQTPTHDSYSRKAASKISDKPSSTHSTTLTLAWAVWQPFESSDTLLDDTPVSVSLELKRGFGFKPTILPSSAHKACYQSNLCDAGKVLFKFISSKSIHRAEGIELFSSSLFQIQERQSPRHLPSGGMDVPDSGAPLSPPPQSSHSPTPKPITPQHKPRLPPSEVKGGSKRRTTREEESVSPEPLHSIEVLGAGQPEISTTDHQFRPSSVPRPVLAYLHSVGMEELKDKKGNPLPVVTPTPLRPAAGVSEDLLIAGPLSITVQIFACSLRDEYSSLSLTLHCSLFPSATFYCSTIPPPRDHTHLPHLLSPLDGDATHLGITYCYRASALSLPTKTDRQELSSLLASGSLFVDLYDRDSLFLLGTAHIPLTSLQTSSDNPPTSHCQSHLSLPLLLPAHTTDTSITTLTPSHITPTHSTASQSGTLYVRIARSPAEAETTVGIDGKEAKRMCITARRLYGGHTHLGAGQRNNEDDQTRARKFARMQKVREIKAKKNGAISSQLKSTQLLSNSDANVIDLQREELKRERIARVLEESLTTDYYLQARLGRLLHFQHPFTNPHPGPITVRLTWSDPELKLVVDRQEADFLRKRFSIHTVLDDCLPSECYKSGKYELLVHPGETVSLPFKYQTFTVTSLDQHSRRKTIKVCLTADQELVGVVRVQIDTLPPPLHHLIHCYHPQRSFFKKQLSLSWVGKVFACCSEPEAICQVNQDSSSSGRGVFIKAPVGDSPCVITLYIMVYYDQQYPVSPSEVWKLCLHSANRVDHSLQMGQSSQVKLLLRAGHTDTRVTCYSFNQSVIRPLSPTPFLLSGQSLTEFPVTLRTLTSGRSIILVSAVAMDNKTVIRRWMVCSEAVPPCISRGFQIALPANGEGPTKKTISFTNPYSKKKSFHVSTNRPDVVVFDKTQIKLHAQETIVLCLNFAPQKVPTTIDMYVFINNSRDLTEECFLVKIVYS